MDNKEIEKKRWGLTFILIPFLIIGLRVVSPLQEWEPFLYGLLLSTGCRLFIRDTNA